jgi:hypothetical protein
MSVAEIFKSTTELIRLCRDRWQQGHSTTCYDDPMLRLVGFQDLVTEEKFGVDLYTLKADLCARNTCPWELLGFTEEDDLWHLFQSPEGRASIFAKDVKSLESDSTNVTLAQS